MILDLDRAASSSAKTFCSAGIRDFIFVDVSSRFFVNAEFAGEAGQAGLPATQRPEPDAPVPVDVPAVPPMLFELPAFEVPEPVPGLSPDPPMPVPPAC